MCIVLLEFVDFQNVWFQLAFDSRLEKLTITSFQPWTFYFDAFGASTQDGWTRNASQLWVLLLMLSKYTIIRPELFNVLEPFLSWDESIEEKSFEYGLGFKEVIARDIAMVD